LPLPGAAALIVTARYETHNDPLSSLTDGKLSKSYGPVFGNGTRDGAYKADLGGARSVAAISSWAYNQNDNRGRQIVTIFGSASSADPGWNTTDSTIFTPITTIDTLSPPDADFSAASIRARKGQSLGSFRWIVWQVEAVTPPGENTAFQEFVVE